MIGFRTMLRGLAIAALVPVLAAPAGARQFDPVEGWELTATPKTCTMTTTYSDNVAVGLVWVPSTSELGFIASLPHPSDVQRIKTTALALSFDGDSQYNEWEDQRAVVIDGADSVGVVANWGADHTADLAKAVAAASHVSVRVGTREVGRYDLSGSPKAYQALMRCGKLIASK